MRKLALLLVVALAVPAAAIAAHKPSHPKPAAPAPTVQYVVKGTVASYDSGAKTLTVNVTGGNSHAKKLFGITTPRVFKLDASTKIVGAPLQSGKKVLVKVRAAKNATIAGVLAIAARQVVETS